MLTFLQLSDIHFRGGRGDAEATEAQDYRQRESLIEDARSVGEEIGGYSAILVAGDIANNGKSEQFAQAGAWLRNLCTAIGVPPWMVWTIPGNHDLDHARIEELQHELRARIRAAEADRHEDLVSQILTADEDGPALFAPLENYLEFADAFDCAFERGQLHWVEGLDFSATHPLELRGLTSALLCTKGDNQEENRMLIGRTQASGWADEKVHFSMCHHPHDWLLDGAEIDALFGANVQVRVTGHLHKRELTPTEIGVYLQAGAVSPKRREDGSYPPDYGPTYDVISLEHSESPVGPFLDIAVHPRVWDDGARCWEGGEDWNRRFALGRVSEPQELDQRPAGEAVGLPKPQRALRYRLAQLPLVDKYDCLEEIGGPVAEFLDKEQYALVTSIYRWAQDNDRLAQLEIAVRKRS